MTPAARPRVRAVLFDLDGTLADTAPDLALALNLTRAGLGLPPVDPASLRPFASEGARGLLREGLQLLPEDPAFDDAREQFLAHYRANLARHTVLFPGVEALLAALESDGLAWGVVTNKPAWLTDPLLQELGLAARSGCAVSGDTTPTPKPHPAPLLLGAQQVGVEPAHCLYVGDDRRDIVAGRAAGMGTLAAAWGYVGTGESPAGWQADAVIEQPGEVLAHALAPALL